MIVEIIPAGGLGRTAPLRIEAAQVLVRQANGTPIAIAAEYGPDRSHAVTMAGQDDFVRTLRNLGIDDPVVCDRIKLLQPPPGARLVAGPTQE